MAARGAGLRASRANGAQQGNDGGFQESRVASTPREQAAEAPVEGDLEAELNQLLAQVTGAKVADKAVPKPTSIATPVAPAPAGEDTDGLSADAASVLASMQDELAVADTTPQAPTASGEDLVGDALAQQIQELLDDAEAQLDAANFLDPSQLPGGTPLTQAEGSRPEPEPQTIGQSPAPAVEAATEAMDPDAMQAAVDKLDESLAHEADEAVSGDFETVADVVGSTPLPLAVPAVEAVTLASNETGPADEDIPEGAFEDPADIVTPTGTTAADLAAELDSQPEKHAAKSKAPATAPGTTPGKAEESVSPAKPRKPVSHRLRAALALVNGPVATLAPANRDLVGYVGAITMLTAVLWITLTLLR